MTVSAPRKSEILREAQKVTVTNYLEGADYLRDVYGKLKTAFAGYNHQDFAELLGFARTNNAIRLIIGGKRALTAKTAEQIAKALGLTGQDRSYWLSLVNYNNASTPSRRDELFKTLMTYKSKASPRKLDETQLKYFGEWYHSVIRELLGVPGIGSDPQKIQEALAFPLRLEKIKQSLALLVEIGAAHQDPDTGRYVKTSETIATDQEVDSLAIVRYHQKMIEMGGEAITRVDETERSINAVTVSLPRSAVPYLKARINQLLDEVLAMEHAEGGDEPDEVYQVNVQLFPFTKGKPKNGKPS